MVPRDEVRRMAPELRTCCWGLDLSTLKTGEIGHRSGELLLSGGERLCLATSLPSTEPFPPGFASSSCVGLEGLLQGDVDVGSVLLATVKEEEQERVGLC